MTLMSPSQSQLLPCQFSRGNQRSQRDYDPRHDDMLDGSGAIVERSLVGVVGETHVSVSQVLGIRQPRYENVGNNARLYKLKFHDFPRLGLVVALAQEEGNHCSKSFARNGSMNSYNHTHLVEGCGKSVVKISLANSKTTSLAASPSRAFRSPATMPLPLPGTHSSGDA